jgi:hypothetical protein
LLELDGYTDYERQLAEKVRQTEDHAEGRASFRERRPPIYRGRPGGSASLQEKKVLCPSARDSRSREPHRQRRDMLGAQTRAWLEVANPPVPAPVSNGMRPVAARAS